MKVASKLKAYRQQKELSLADITARTGVTPSVISRLETGKVNCKISTLKTICQKGLNLTDPEWEEMQAHWLAQRTGVAISAQGVAGQMAQSNMASRAGLDKFMDDIGRLSDRHFTALKAMIKRPEVMEMLVSVAKSYK